MTLVIIKIPYLPLLENQNIICIITCWEWQILQIEKVLDIQCNQEIENYYCLNANHISLGHIIVIEQNKRLVTDLVKEFALVINYIDEYSIAAAAIRNDVIVKKPFYNCPMKFKNCYYLQMSEKINCSKINFPTLRITFWEPVTVNIKVYNLHNNFCGTKNGMLGLLFSD